MSREYAVVSREAGAERVLFCTARFDPDRVTETVPLSGGAELRVSGSDELRAEMAELSRLLQEAQEANTAKEVFLSNMSHDIRTPMNAIVGMTALAKKHIDEKARVSDALGKIEVASAHLLGLINDVLDMSRINSGRMTVAEELFSLSDLLHDVLTIVRPQAEQRFHSFHFRAGRIFVEGLYGDALRLRQIFVNIVNNAVKYTPEHGEISVTVSEEDAPNDRVFLCFDCRDNGIGMEPAFLQRIFEPFERVSSSTVSRIEGTGLGMSIVKKLLDAMGGEIAIDSAPGRGTEVRIRIPMRYERLRLNTEALVGRRLLILEADEDQRERFLRYLGEVDLEKRVVSDTAEALSAMADADFQGRGYDAVILGKSISGDGDIFDVASYLHKSQPELVIVLVSEAVWDDIEYRANRCGISCFIPAPVFRKSLLNGLNEALQENAGRENDFGAPDLSGRRILLVEDNAINREIACELLSMTGAEVDTAEDGSLAVERFTSVPEGYYDLVLMDIQMPVMNGYDAARAIRASGRADAGVKICAMTANTFAEDISRARAAGMDGHIAKPIDIHVLMGVLRQL